MGPSQGPGFGPGSEGGMSTEHPIGALAMGVTSGDCWLPGARGPKDRQGWQVWAWALPLARELEAWRACRLSTVSTRLEVAGGGGRGHPEEWHCTKEG